MHAFEQLYGGGWTMDIILYPGDPYPQTWCALPRLVLLFLSQFWASSYFVRIIPPSISLLLEPCLCLWQAYLQTGTIQQLAYSGPFGPSRLVEILTEWDEAWSTCIWTTFWPSWNISVFLNFCCNNLDWNVLRLVFLEVVALFFFGISTKSDENNVQFQYS